MGSGLGQGPLRSNARVHSGQALLPIPSGSSCLALAHCRCLINTWYANECPVIRHGVSGCHQSPQALALDPTASGVFPSLGLRFLQELGGNPSGVHKIS